MEEEMFTFFPNGIRALLVDDDSKFLKSSTMMLSLLQFKVATCGSPTSAMRLLSGDRVKDVDVVLADAHQVSACGFDLCTIVENDLNIPVIYFMSSSESPAAAGDAQSSSRLARVVQSATFIIKKPLDVGELSSLWRAVAWRRCVLEDARRAKDCIDLLDSINNVAAERVHYKVVRASNGGGRRRNNRGVGDDDIDGGAGCSESQKHRVMWTPCLKKKFEHALKFIGTGVHPSEILKHMNMKGLRRHHVASYLQKYRAKLEKKKNDRCGGAPSPCSYDNAPKEFPIIRSFLPTPNSQIFTGGAGPSNVDAVEGFTGENDATAALPPSWAWHPPLFRQPSGNSVIADTRASAMPPTTDEQQSSSSIIEARNVAAMAFAGGNGAPAALPSWSPSFRNPVGDDVSSSSAVPLAMQAAEEQQPFSDAAAFTGIAAPALPPWDAMLHQPTEDVSGIIALKAAIQAEQQLSSGAAEDVIDQQMFFGPFTYQDPFPPPAAPNTFDVQGEVEQQQQQVMVAAAAAEEDAAAAMVAQMVAASDNINGLAVPSYDDGELGAIATAGNEGITFAQLEAFLQLDAPVGIDGAAAAANGSRGMMNGDEGGTKDWDLGTDQGSVFLDEILRDSTGDDATE